MRTISEPKLGHCALCHIGASARISERRFIYLAVERVRARSLTCTFVLDSDLQLHDHEFDRDLAPLSPRGIRRPAEGHRTTVYTTLEQARSCRRRAA